MLLLFKKAQYGGIAGRLIAAWTRGPYCHVELVLDELEQPSLLMYSADSDVDGVRCLSFGQARLDQYTIFRMPPLSDVQRHQILPFMYA